ncbi:MAG: DUF3047 domain-containing protein [Proteobacteria bacterium]|nr:DUF3047 domain-containing protein [Pseudomonadota bacterium]
MLKRSFYWYLVTYTLILLCISAAPQAHSEEENPLFREDFNDLNSWKPLYFPKIKKHTSYTIESNGSENYLKAESNASASAVLYRKDFNIYQYSRMRWRWKVENVYTNGDAKTKSGDDYPLRIYIVFKYDPEKAGFMEKVKYNAAKLIYGEYPPHSGLNYIWANREHEETIIINAFTEKSKMILLQKGNSNIGKWLNEDVNIRKDYEEAFGEKPPPIASIAIMNDSDNTGEKSISYLDYIELYR